MGRKILQSKINRRIIKSLGKLSVVFLMIVFSANLSQVYSTSSSFRDAETSSSNSFTALSLDVEAVSGEVELQDPLIAANMIEGDMVTRGMILENVGSIDYEYNVAFDKTSGDDALCLGLNLRVEQDTIEVYDGSLMAFDYDAGIMTPGDIQDWDFEITLPLGSPSELEELDCNFEFNLVAWQTTMPGPGSGWWDEEIIDSNIIHSGSWTSPAVGDIVMNEFLPNPVGADTDPMPNGEWIEIFNNSLVNRDLDGWYFEDASGNVLTISASNSDNDGDTGDSGETLINGSGGYLVVYDDSIFSLNNGGDTINFYDKLGVLMDSYTYGDTSVFPAGKSYARAPDGVGAWVDPEPTPGEKVEFSDEELLEFRKVIFEDCFKDDKLIKNRKQPMCRPVTVEYFGLIDDEDSKKLTMTRDLKKYLEELSKLEAAASEEAPEVKEEVKKEIPKIELKEVPSAEEEIVSEVIKEEISGEETVNEDSTDESVSESVTNDVEEVIVEEVDDTKESDDLNEEAPEETQEEPKEEDPIEELEENTEDSGDSEGESNDSKIDDSGDAKEEEIKIEVVE